MPPLFRDNDSKLRGAREAAYHYLREIKIRNILPGGIHLSARDVAQTLNETIIPVDDDDELLQAADNLQKKNTGADYVVGKQWNAQDMEKLKQLVRVIEQLADPGVMLDGDSWRAASVVLAEAPTFLMSRIIPAVSNEEVEAADRCADSVTITRRINQHHHPRLAPGAAEYTRDDLRNTRDILGYTHEQMREINQALAHLLAGVSHINAALSGKSPDRPRDSL